MQLGIGIKNPLKVVRLIASKLMTTNGNLETSNDSQSRVLFMNVVELIRVGCKDSMNSHVGHNIMIYLS